MPVFAEITTELLPYENFWYESIIASVLPQVTVSLRTVRTISIEGNCFTKSFSTPITGIKLQNAHFNNGQ